MRNLDLGLWLGSLLFLLGVFLYEAAQSAFLIYIAAAVLCVVCAIHAVGTLFFGRLNVWALVSTQTLLWYLLPFIYSGLIDYETINSIPFGDNVKSLLLVVASAGIAYTLSGLFPVIHWRPVDVRPGQLYTFVTPFILAQVALLVTGQWGYQIILDEAVWGKSTVSEINMLMLGITPALAPLLAFHLGRELLKAEYGTALLILCALAIQVVWWLPMGRRLMAVEIIVSGIAFFAAFYSMRLSARRVLVLCLSGVAMLPVLYLMWTIFFSFRQASYLIDSGSSGATVAVADLLDYVRRAGDISESFSENLLSRPFIINSVSICINAASGFLFGKQLLTQLVVSLPAPVFPWKSHVLEMLGGVHETLWLSQLGIPFTDYANTLFLESYLDFGIAGFPIYLLIVTSLCLAVCKIYASSRSALMQTYCYAAVGINLLSIENAVGAQFILARDLMIVFVLFWLVRLLFHGWTEDRFRFGRLGRVAQSQSPVSQRSAAVVLGRREPDIKRDGG